MRQLEVENVVMIKQQGAQCRWLQTRQHERHQNTREPRGQQKIQTLHQRRLEITAQQDQQQKHGDAPTADLTETKAEAWT